MTMRIPLSSPDITEAEIAAVTAVLRTPHLSLGAQLIEFENQIARTMGSKYAAAVSSGTAALHLALLAAGIKAGDEVIVPSFAFIAVANAVSYVGALPVFVDIDARTLNLDPSAVQAAITPHTRAIIVVHTFGVPAAMRELQEIAARHNLQLIEDACEAIGGEYDGHKLGSLGRAGVFGFYPNKQITTGEGGVVVSNDPYVIGHARMMRNHGRGPTADRFDHQFVGYNYRISEINCALGVVQVQRLPEILQKRAAIAQLYHERLQTISEIELPPLAVDRGSISWFVYVVRLKPQLNENPSNRIIAELMQRNIGCSRYFAPIHLQPAYRQAPHRCMDLRITESLAHRTIALPFFNRLTVAQIDEVCFALKAAIAKL
jgi:perosamine synthetase